MVSTSHGLTIWFVDTHPESNLTSVTGAQQIVTRRHRRTHRRDNDLRPIILPVQLDLLFILDGNLSMIVLSGQSLLPKLIGYLFAFFPARAVDDPRVIGVLGLDEVNYLLYCVPALLPNLIP